MNPPARTTWLRAPTAQWLGTEPASRQVGARASSEIGVPVRSLLCLQDVIEYLDLSAVENKDHEATLAKIRSYQQAHCAGQPIEATPPNGASDSRVKIEK